uniref:Fe2OG dioxygenase domain-containing protein n=1 Tax=Bionectria ochroleuca TaxID=29856 RepID=A0A8H7MZ77_BIOOC
MFLFDASALPQLTTRKAFIGVDFQHDFCDPDGVFPATEPEGFVDRAVQLATAIRASGDIVWVRTKPDGHRSPDAEQIIVSDDPLAGISMPWRTRRGARVPIQDSGVNDDTPTEPDAEAFLSQSEPSCLTSPAGVALAFPYTQLLLILRAKMVMEVFICGSLTNVGLYATAMDAARHGLSITIVEDCCGYHSKDRQIIALQRLVETTGCEVASAKDIIKSFENQPKKPAISRKSSRPDRLSKAASDNRRPTPPAKSIKADDIAKSLSELTIAPDAAENRGTEKPTNSKPVKKTPKPSGASIGAEAEADVPKDGIKADSQAAAPQSKPLEDTSHVGRVANKRTIKEGKSDQDIANLMVHLNIEDTSKNQAQTNPEMEAKPDQSHPNHNDPGEDNKTLKAHQDGICEGDTHVIENVLPKELEDGKVAEDGSIPVYRHPSDEAPPLLTFSPTVFAIKEATEKQVGHPLNHVLIQYYRDGNDYISEHSDKTLDIVKDSFIANVSLGAERTMVLRTKRLDKDPSRTESSPDHGNKKRQVQRARLPHNSLFRMGLRTNMKWLHAIRQDKRAERDKTADELAYSGGRISLTFRNIGTFLSKEQTLIWGQGATGKVRDDARPVINGQSPEAIKMLKAFGTENHASKFDWDASYGKGFDVLHMSNSPRFFASPDPVVNMRISFMLAEYDINHAKGNMGPAKGDTEPDTCTVPVKFVDNDAARSVVEGDASIMLYLDAIYGHKQNEVLDQASVAKKYTRFQQGLNLLKAIRLRKASEKDTGSDVKFLQRDLAPWNVLLRESENKYLAGESPSLPDFVLWPVLHALFEQHGSAIFERAEHLECYFEKLGTRESVKKLLAKDTEGGS